MLQDSSLPRTAEPEVPVGTVGPGPEPGNPTFFARYAAWGILFGFGSAVGYALTNAFLRQAAAEPPIWVSGIKAACTAAIFLPWFLWLAGRGVRVLPPPRMCWGLLAVSVFVQYFGNVYYQYALQTIGLALAVPVNLGVMIFSGAVLGRAFMREPLTPKITLGLAIIVTSIAILSSQKAPPPIIPSAAGTWFAGITAASLSGVAYAVLGLVIRRSMRHQIPLATPIVFVSVVGTVGLLGLSYLQEGPTAIAAIGRVSWIAMITAGILNGIAFLSLTQALKMLPVVYVNGINAANMLFSALIALIYFLEPWSPQLGWGIAVMLVGLGV